MTGGRPNRVPEIKNALTDVTRVLEVLGLLGTGKARQRQAGGWVIRCPVHDDRTPSCSVQLREGLIVWRCHGCGAAGDVLTLVARARGLSMRGGGFRDVLVEAARLGGLWAIVDELRGRGEAPAPAPGCPRDASVEPERGYPPTHELEAFWASCAPVEAYEDVAGYLASRGIDPGIVDGRELARAVGTKTILPSWARCRGGTWMQSGHRLVVAMYDAAGVMRSVRAWRVTVGDLPKRLPPSGHKASGLVMADGFALAMLRGARQPERVGICEGEPDMLTWATRTSDARTAVLGIVSGSWTEALAAHFRPGMTAYVWTDNDPAGERYASDIAESLKRRCFVKRCGVSDGAA